MPRRRPKLQLRIARRPQLEQDVVAAIVQLDTDDTLRMAAVEVFGQAQHGGERPDDATALAFEIAEALVPAVRRRAAVVARNQGDHLDLFGFEAAQIAVANQIVRVLVVALVADMHADVMKKGCIAQPLALAVSEPVRAARAIEQGIGEPRDLVRVFRPVVAALGELDDAALADVRVPIGLRDFLAMARDVVEDETLAQRQVAEGELGGAETADDRVEQDRSSDGKIAPARIEAGNLETALEV